MRTRGDERKMDKTSKRRNKFSYESEFTSKKIIDTNMLLFTWPLFDKTGWFKYVMFFLVPRFNTLSQQPRLVWLALANVFSCQPRITFIQSMVPLHFSSVPKGRKTFPLILGLSFS